MGRKMLEFKVEVDTNKPEDALAIVAALAEDMIVTGDYGLLEEFDSDDPDPLKDAEWSNLVLRLLRKIGVANSDTSPSTDDVIMATEEAIKHWTKDAECQARVERIFEEVEKSGALRSHRYITEGTIRQDETHYPDRCGLCSYEALKKKEGV